MPFDLSQTVTILYADCPWRYDSVRTGGSMTSGAAQQYPTLSVEELCALPIKRTVPAPSLLFLWATVPLGTDPYDVLKAWGYTYKTSLFWRKQRPGGKKGIGYWFRNEVEVLLLGARGYPPPPPFRSIRGNIIDAPVEAHSRKPAIFRQIIEEETARYPARRLVELFARERVPGWASYGLDFGHDVTQPRFWDSELPAALTAPEVGALGGPGDLAAADAPAVPLLKDSAGA